MTACSDQASIDICRALIWADTISFRPVAVRKTDAASLGVCDTDFDSVLIHHGLDKDPTCDLRTVVHSFHWKERALLILCWRVQNP